MAEIINLRLARKARGRRDAKAVADANRIAFGRTRAERERDEAVRLRAERTLDQARRDEDDKS